jgi:small subunit ribosomal protein S13
MPKEDILVRLVDRDLKGTVNVLAGISRVKGAGLMIASAICHILDIDRNKRVGDLSAEDLKKIEDCMRNPAKYNFPKWMLNHRKEPETGEDSHYISADLTLKQNFDIRRMRKMKTHKGHRHALGSKKVRGQSTRSTGRKKGAAVGVQRKKPQPKSKPKQATKQTGGKKKGKK